jgi:hypothetical protein
MSLDTLADIERPQVTAAPSALFERLNVLHNAVGLSRARVERQSVELEDLRREIVEYSQLMERLKAQERSLEERSARLLAAEVVRVEEPASPLLPETWALNADPELVLLAAPRGREFTVGALGAAASARAQRPLWARALPYAALGLLALGLGVEGLRYPAHARIPSSLAALPAPPAPALSAEEQALSDETVNGDVLALVYSYVAPGARKNVHDLLSPELETAIGGSPWVLAQLDDKTTLVSFHPDGEPEEGAPVYEFAVDLAAQTVTASPETIRNLRGGLASAR